MTRINVSLIFKVLALGLFGISIQAQDRRPLSIDGQEFTPNRRTDRPGSRVPLNICPDVPFRSIDGTCNNISRLTRIEWGASDIPLRRSMLPAYGSEDHYNSMAGSDRPSPRTISNAVCAQTSETPSERGLSSFVFTWGQFLDHDIDLTPEGHDEYEPILLPADEPLFNLDIPFFRSSVYENTGDGNYREQTNLITSYIDGSNVYGSDLERADWLRTFSGGKLKSSFGNLLPFNTVDGELSSEIDPDAPSMAGDNGGTNKTFVAGDVRAAEQPGLTALHTLFMRHHNNICDRLLSQGVNNDEELYQRARKEVGASIQAITYNEFLPALGVHLERYRGHNENVQPDVSNLFASAAYRLGHTMVTDELLLKDDMCGSIASGEVSLLEGFFNPNVIKTYNIEPILSGLAFQIQNEVDTRIIDNLRNFLFGDPSSGTALGLDLASLNIQRGRDHGLPDYNSVRRHYTGRVARDFRDITSDRDLRQKLQTLYGDINNIDLWVGLLAEDKERGTSLGPTLQAIIKDQLGRLRDGDRYFYLGDRFLNDNQRNRLDNLKLSDIILENTSINNIQENVFVANVCDNSNIASSDDTSEIAENRNAVREDISIEVFPNPATSVIQVNINGLDNNSYILNVVDMTGRIITRELEGNPNIRLDISDYREGIYNIVVTSGSKQFYKRFVKVMP